ncbi:thermonuclease family protein [Polaromonas sp.]|uniref:thermonuclease family protein n=1 Tax=Polaromonas sp. TaxID=1869339 RepID=UPI003453963A
MIEPKQIFASICWHLTVEIDGKKIDRYGRLVGKVLVGGRDANLSQIEAGMAWHYKQYQREQSVADRVIYSEAETKAASSKQGLWIENNPVAPWDWRKDRSDKSKPGQTRWIRLNPRLCNLWEQKPSCRSRTTESASRRICSHMSLRCSRRLTACR